MRSYDHATSLGFNLSDQRRDQLASDPAKLHAWLERGTASRFEGGRHVTLVSHSIQAIHLAPSWARAWWSSAVTARDVKDFLPFLGFTDLTAEYQSPWLFPIFAQRVLNPRRSDYPHWRDVLDLPADATPFEFLARCEGRREGDAVLVTAPPTVDGHGAITFTFLVHGVRHALQVARAQNTLSALRDGDDVNQRQQPDNAVDRLAIHVCSGSVPIGWVPRLLCPAVHDALAEGHVSGRVLKINGPEVPPHMRLLVELNGSVAPGWDFFAEPTWSSIAG